MGERAVVHDFRERLRFSERASDEPFWQAVYRKAFPGMVTMSLCPGNTQAQRIGIDRVITLSSGKILRIDEKKREKVYQDILLEYLSVDATGAPGWIEKDLLIDFLAYAFMPTQRVYLFPWEMLRRAWLQFGGKWKEEYPHIEAKNNGYSTWSVPVPIRVLRSAVHRAAIIQL